MHYDYLIVGAGIIGLTTAYQLRKLDPDAAILILEKEKAPALHQTGRNSGVVHTGIYHKKGSLKEKNCRLGREMLLNFCDELGVGYQKIHKVIIATHQSELKRLDALYVQGKENGVEGLSLLNADELKEVEPHAAGLKAIHVPNCHILNYGEVAKKLAIQFDVKYQVRVGRISSNLIETSVGDFRAKKVINCAGLYSDRLAGKNRIIPFRGEYYEVKKTELVRGLIYPVPDPTFPFLGVHLTVMTSGQVEAGPNAVFSMGREGYMRNMSREMLWSLQHKGFWKMALRYWKAGAYELMRSRSKALFLRDLQRLVPAIQSEDLVPGHMGIRAQVVNSNGTMMDDFAFERQGDVLHVINAPSPAATASFAIGKTIANMISLSGAHEKAH